MDTLLNSSAVAGWPFITLQAIGATYSFVALVIVCDQYFMPSVASALKRFGLKNDVAGATIVAIGSSAPEFLTATLAVFISSDDQCITCTLSSAVYNLSFVIGICALFSRTDRPLHVTWWPFLRDSIFFIIAIVLLVKSSENSRIYFWESSILLLLYISYLVLMVFNKTAKNFVMGKFCKKKPDDLESDGAAISPEATAEYEQEENETQCDRKPDAGNWNRMTLVVAALIWPVKLILNLTLPKSDGSKYMLWGYLGSIIWIAIFSFLLVQCVEPVGGAIGIPSEILVVLAGGAFPELINSVLIARKGHGDMIMSAALGSTIADICVGLPLPWLIFSLYFEQPMWVVPVENQSILLFGGVVFIVGISIMCFRWRLTKGFGIILLLLYLFFLLFNTLFEYGFF